MGYRSQIACFFQQSFRQPGFAVIVRVKEPETFSNNFFRTVSVDFFGAEIPFHYDAVWIKLNDRIVLDFLHHLLIAGLTFAKLLVFQLDLFNKLAEAVVGDAFLGKVTRYFEKAGKISFVVVNCCNGYTSPEPGTPFLQTPAFMVGASVFRRLREQLLRK